ncbi:FlgO family outer membrane protein [Halodesulfovibrio sp.]|uniref:FlgO family outer membrane protein n=1 Tax=Halodesulfovibrio sp. TaxID=1912772 RepID=UPI0025BABEBD|nr:FlgO family outer membrane protein [Halodesulfovibrio sp.]
MSNAFRGVGIALLVIMVGVPKVWADEQPQQKLYGAVESMVPESADATYQEDTSLTSVTTVVNYDNGVMLPDGTGGMLWRQGSMQPDVPAVDNAREVKLKVRELADQLLTDLDWEAFKSASILPVTFVEQDNFERSSAFGRYIAEALIYEFNQRNVPVKEYRIGNEIKGRRGEGEFMLTRNHRTYVKNRRSLAVVGTYYQVKGSVFVNARMVRVSDNSVLRTAQLVFQQTDVVRRMLADTGPKLSSGFVSMRDFETMTRANDLTAIDLGEDLH